MAQWEQIINQKAKNALLPKKRRLTLKISEGLIERFKNAVYWTPGITLSSLAEEGLFWAVRNLEQERKGPFPQREEELKTGRPIE